MNRNDVKEMVHELTTEQKYLLEQQRKDFLLSLDDLENEAKNDNLGVNSIASLLSLPDEQFAILAPVFLEEFEASYNDPNQQMILTQLYNSMGITHEDLLNDVVNFKKKIDEVGGDLSAPKKSFLKQIVNMCYNASTDVDALAKRQIRIPIEYCREGAKMPTYAHLTDAGMDIYATESITIGPGETKVLQTGLKVAIPAGYELQIRAKSGCCVNTKLRVANAPATINL